MSNLKPVKSANAIAEVIHAMIAERRVFTDDEQSRMLIALLEDGFTLQDIRTFLPWIIRDQYQWWTSAWSPSVTTYFTYDNATLE